MELHAALKQHLAFLWWPSRGQVDTEAFELLRQYRVSYACPNIAETNNQM